MAGTQVKEGEYTTTIYGMVSCYLLNFPVLKWLSIGCNVVDSGCSGT